LEATQDWLRAIDFALYVAAEENDFKDLDELLDDRLETQQRIDYLEAQLAD
nr:hypothetical protein [Tanacetum cinerariifolium]